MGYGCSSRPHGKVSITLAGYLIGRLLGHYTLQNSPFKKALRPTLREEYVTKVFGMGSHKVDPETMFIIDPSFLSIISGITNRINLTYPK